MKIKFREAKLGRDNKDRLVVINGIVEEYQAEGYVLTLRQLYYQLVSRDIIPNKQAEYAKLSTLLKEGRMAGIVDWDAIEDRLRQPSKPSSFDSPKDVLDAAINQYQLPRQQGQETYIEVWVEKDALSGVLKRVTEKYHIPIMVNRGYSSVSAMFDAYMRFLSSANKDQYTIILYLGDFDPSGLDMIRDIIDRTTEFDDGYGCVLESEGFKVRHIALTKNQINTYDPPPNPAKVTDPRAKEFIRRYGDTSWEVDALRPEVLHSLLENTILDIIDQDKYQRMVDKEENDKNKLKSLKQYL